MAMIFMDGFDANDIASKWNLISTTSSSTTITRFGTGRAQFINYTGHLIKYLPAASTQLFIGFGSNVTADSAVGSKLITLYGDGGTVQHLRLEVANASTLRVTRGNGTVLATSAFGAHTSGAWEYIEFMVVIDDINGRAVVRINGVDIIDFTGDTKNGGTNSSIDMLRFSSLGVNDGPRNYYVDDLYVLDSSSTTNNDFLGDVRIHTLPVTGPGIDTQLTPTGSATNWQNVDEMPASATDYNSSATPGERDSYAHQDLPTGVTTVHSIQTNLTLGKSDAGSAFMKPLVRSGGTVYYDPDVNLSSSAVLYSIPHDVDPATSAPWTVSGTNAMETGAEVA